MQALLYSLRGSPKMRKILNKGDEMRGSLPGEICPSGQYELSHEAGLCQRRAVEVRDGLGGEGGWEGGWPETPEMRGGDRSSTLLEESDKLRRAPDRWIFII
jgi:hypothetical protein